MQRNAQKVPPLPSQGLCRTVSEVSKGRVEMSKKGRMAGETKWIGWVGYGPVPVTGCKCCSIRSAAMSVRMCRPTAVGSEVKKQEANFGD